MAIGEASHLSRAREPNGSADAFLLEEADLASQWKFCSFSFIGALWVIIENMTKQLWGVCKSILSLHSEHWKGKKLRNNIKIRGELFTFNFHFPKMQDVFRCLQLLVFFWGLPITLGLQQISMIFLSKPHLRWNRLEK